MSVLDSKGSKEPLSLCVGLDQEPGNAVAGEPRASAGGALSVVGCWWRRDWLLWRAKSRAEEVGEP